MKGAFLFQVWTEIAHRPTRDLDLLGRGDPSIERCASVILDLAAALPVVDDGLIFDAGSIRASAIREDNLYHGVRVELAARLGQARIPVQIDIGFGDAATPALIEYPALLPQPAPWIQAYPMETVVSEKVEAMVSLGMINSRMKDFHDVWFLAATFPFDGARLRDSIAATFERRGTRWDPEGLAALLDRLAADPAKNVQWLAFLNKNRLPAADFGRVTSMIRTFAAAEILGHASWPAGGPWAAAAAA